MLNANSNIEGELPLPVSTGKELAAGGRGRPAPASCGGHLCGVHGQDVGLSFASAMEAIVHGRDPRPSLLQAAKRLVYGPDGPNDPRGKNGTALRSY